MWNTDDFHQNRMSINQFLMIRLHFWFTCFDTVSKLILNGLSLLWDQTTATIEPEVKQRNRKSGITNRKLRHKEVTLLFGVTDGISVLFVRRENGVWNSYAFTCTIDLSLAVADLHSKILDARPPPGVQILSISCSFWEILAKSYVGAPPRGVGAPSSGKS